MAAADQAPIGSGFPAKTTARDVLAGIDLSGKNIIVTGGYSGIGLETVRALAGAGAIRSTLDDMLRFARAAMDTLHGPLAAAMAQVVAAEASLGAARSDYLPTLSLQANYSRSGQKATDTGGVNGTDGVFGDPRRNYGASVGLVLGWNLFAGRSTEAGVARATASAERVRAGAGKTTDAVAREVTSARQTVVALAAQVTLSADNLSAAEQSLKLARQRLEAGLASQLEVRDASLKFTQAELSLVQARIDHAVATADLARACGGAI